MAIKLTDMRNRTYRLEYEYQGDTMAVEYPPNAVDREFVEAVGQIEDSFESAAFQIGKVVKSWDLLDENDQPIPPADPLVASLPLPFTTGLLAAIVEDVKARKKG